MCPRGSSRASDLTLSHVSVRVFFIRRAVMSAVSVRILKGKSEAIGGPKERAQEAVHRSPSPELLSVLLRPYWSPPPRSLLPTPVRCLLRFFRDSRSPLLVPAFTLFHPRFIDTNRSKFQPLNESHHLDIHFLFFNCHIKLRSFEKKIFKFSDG